jgi:hypothetical protein
VHPIGTATEFTAVATRESAGRDGGPIGPQQSALDVARAVVACARRPRAEVYPHRASRVLVWMNAVAPGLVDRVAVWQARKAGRL